MRYFLLFLLALALSTSCDDEKKSYDWNTDGGVDSQTDAQNDASDGDVEEDIIHHNDPPPELSGLWAQKQVLASVINYPMIGAVDTFHINYILVEITQDGTTLIAEERTCAIDIEADTDLQTTVIPDAFVESMSVEEKPAHLQPTAEGYAFFQPQYYQLQGVTLTDVESEELPSTPDDPRVFDQDNDGYPGVTVRLTGTLSGELYVISREYTILTSGAATAEGFEGLIDWEGAQITLEASTAILNTTPESATHPDPAFSYFKYVPVPAGTTCEEIKAQKETLFQ